jgi:diguanylate cyclase (GGDEF)-like protein/PAS domain S-box-containing protein
VEEKKRYIEALRESEERYRRLVELSPDGIAITMDSKFVFLNPAGIRILGGTSPENFLGRSVFDIFDPDHHDNIAERFRKMEEEGEAAPWMELRIFRLDGDEINIELASTPFMQGSRPAIQSIFRDVTERKLAEQHLEYLANFDSLTGLPNRRLFFDRMGRSILNAQREKYQVGLLYLDLDRFKEVNDSFGHAVGDLLLKETSLRLTQSLRLSDTAARMGGDEFTVILTKIVDAEDAAIVARRIIAGLAKPVVIEGHELTIGVSIGIGIYPLDGEDVDSLLKKADTAMYRAKEKGSNLFRYYHKWS